MTKEKREPTEDELEERFGLTEAEYDAIEESNIHEKAANFVRTIMSPKGNVTEKKTNMRTLRTISVMLPMTLLLACGGGGGGGYSGSVSEYNRIPDVQTSKSLAPDSSSEETQTQISEPINLPAPDSPAPDSIENIIIPNIPVHLSYGHWDATWNGCGGKWDGCKEEKKWINNQLVYGVFNNDLENGRFIIRRITPNGPIDSTFDGAEYNGHSVVKRTDREFINGDVRVNLKQNNSGRFTIDFTFSNMDGVPNVEYTIPNYDTAGANFKTPGFEYPKNSGDEYVNGLQGAFSSPNNEHVSGFFGGEGIHIGVFGAEKD